MIGNTWLHHLINDSLMPELLFHKNDSYFRDIWREWHSDIIKDSPVFIHPIKAFQVVGLDFTEEIKQDLEQLALFSRNVSDQPPLKRLIEFFPLQYRQRVYALLIWQTLHDQFYLILSLINEESSIKHQQYILMHYLMDLEQWMDDNHQKSEKSSHHIIRQTYSLFLGFFWLKYIRYYKDLLYINSLRYFEEDVAYQLNQMYEKTKLLQEFLLDQLKEKPALIQEDFENIAPAEIVAELKEDLKGIKAGLKHMQQPLKMEEDVYLQPKDVRKEFKIAESTLAKYRKEGKLKKFKKVGNRFEYSREELREVLGR